MNATPVRVDADWLRQGALPALLTLLDADGEEARVVGGAVRNAMFGQTPDEIDIATTATPDCVIERGENIAQRRLSQPGGIEAAPRLRHFVSPGTNWPSSIWAGT